MKRMHSYAACTVQWCNVYDCNLEMLLPLVSPPQVAGHMVEKVLGVQLGATQDIWREDINVTTRKEPINTAPAAICLPI